MARRTALETRDYAVTLRFQHPAWDEVNGITFHVRATNKREAIALARKDAERDGHLVGRGRYSFKATEDRG